MSKEDIAYSVIISDYARIMLLEHIMLLSQANIAAAEKLYASFEKAFK